MKRVIIVLLALFAAVNVSAQELRWGVAGGLNFAWERAKVAEALKALGAEVKNA